MKLITQRDLILEVVRRWDATYPPGKHGYGADKDKIRAALARLDLHTATADEVNGIIGNGSWTDLTCNDCGTSVTSVVEVGEPRDYESDTALLCEVCARKAVSLFAEVAP